MASPLPTGKQSVNLKAPVRVSRIRRDPPPPVKKVPVRDPEERDTQMVVVGVVAFALAIVVITVAVSSAWGWSPTDYTIHLTEL
ncbi:MAG: hypothetical protein HOP96_04090 [Sphingomonas sp.]|nr:hypothetical protein [Sphingomonas sp.]